MLSEFASMSEITRFMFFWTLPALLIETWLLGRWLAWRPLTAFRNVLLAHLVSFGVNFWLYSTGFFSAVAAATVWGRTMSFDVSSENGILIFLYDAISYPLMVMFSTMIEPLLLLLLPPPRIPKSRVCVFAMLSKIITFAIALVVGIFLNLMTL